MASDGLAWEAAEGIDAGDTFLTWGPYQDLPPGAYAACFRLRGSVPADAPLLVDVFMGGRLASAKVGADRLGEEYADVPLPFDVRQAGQAEYRVRWLGRGSVAADRVIVLHRLDR